MFSNSSRHLFNDDERVVETDEYVMEKGVEVVDEDVH